MDRDSLPRVPDTHGDVVDEKLFSDLYIRTSWVDAQVALDQIDKVSAQKDLLALCARCLRSRECVCVRACAQAYVSIKPGLEVLFNEAIKPLGQFLIQFIADISRRFLSRVAALHFVFVSSYTFYSIYFNRVVCGFDREEKLVKP